MRRSPRSCASTRRAVAGGDPAGDQMRSPAVQWTSLLRRIRRRKASSRSAVPVAARSASGVSSATRLPSRISSSRSQRPASSMTWLETNNVVPAAARAWNRSHRSLAQHGVEPDGRLVEDQQFGRGEQGTRQGDPRPLPARQRAHLLGHAVGQADLGERTTS